MKNLILFILVVITNNTFGQIKLNFVEPCKACGIEYFKTVKNNNMPSFIQLDSQDHTQQIGFSQELIEFVDAKGGRSADLKKYIHCSITTKEKPKSKRLYIQLSDNSKINMIGVKVEYNPNTELYTISGKKMVDSKKLQNRLKYNTISHFGTYQETVPIDNVLAYYANNLFLCIFFR